MYNKEMLDVINSLLDEIDKLIPAYMQISEDSIISNGNVAVCIIDASGMVYGKMFFLWGSLSRNSTLIFFASGSSAILNSKETFEVFETSKV